MAIDDKALQSFFQKQKKASTDALVPSSLRKHSQKKHISILSNSPTSSNFIVSKALANSEQSVSNALAEPLAKREQSVSNSLIEDTTKLEYLNKPLAEPLAEALAKREQSVSKPLASYSFESLVGKERQLLLFLFNKCKTNGSLETPLITSEELRMNLKITANRLRNLIFRLTNKGFLKIKEIKNGRAGWRKFIFSKDIYQQLILDSNVSKALANSEQSVSNTLAEPLAEALAGNSSSSSSLSIKNTTTTGETPMFLNEWQTVDIEPLAEFGFTQTHLTQIAQQGKLSMDIVQNSIHAFAFDLKHNNKAKTLKTDPINFFMGILRNGKPYAPPGNYYSPQEEAMQRYVERQREIEQKRGELEKAAIELAFKEWMATLSEDDKNRIIPHFARNLKAEIPKLSVLKDHFIKEIWPTKQVQITQQNA